jgi:hypothetical protein
VPKKAPPKACLECPLHRTLSLRGHQRGTVRPWLQRCGPGRSQRPAQCGVTGAGSRTQGHWDAPTPLHCYHHPCRWWCEMQATWSAAAAGGKETSNPSLIHFMPQLAGAVTALSCSPCFRTTATTTSRCPASTTCITSSDEVGNGCAPADGARVRECALLTDDMSTVGLNAAHAAIPVRQMLGRYSSPVKCSFSCTEGYAN